MEENQGVEKKRPGRGLRKNPRLVRYAVEFKLRAVKLHLEEGFPQELVCQEMGMGTSTFSGWLKRYREQGEEGLRFLLPLGGGGSKKRSRLPGPVVEKILELKRQNPWWGIKRIAQALRRMFFLQASPESVRTRLHEAGLMQRQQRRAKGKRNLSRPRFFERSTPNQMWQSDIFTFRLGGRYAYLIAFLDDYSRFVVGADLFRSPTAQAVIEVYRVAAGEYQPPKEMLTDNGRQYASWRGTSRFEWEMKKDHIIHIKSRPQHPMTLGKVERFWATIWQDFLVRAQFESFESARERIKLWIKYYNHRKPHQGIGGLCPADRYFEIQSELRKTIEAGIKSNLLEMALRGQPRAPFYMVGRMEGQSVVLRAEKGKLKLSVDDEQENQTKELEYDLNKGEEKNEKGNQSIKPSEAGDKQSWAQTTNALAQLQCAGESAGGAGSVDRAGASGADLPTVIHQPDQLPPMAGTGDGGNAPSTGEPGEPGRWRSAQPALAEAPGQAPAGKSSELSTLHPVGEHPERGPTPERQSTTNLNEKLQTQSPATSERDPASALGPDQRERGSEVVRHLAQDLLPMGEAGAQGHASTAGGTSAGAPPQTNRLEAGGDSKEDRPAGGATQSSQPDGASASDPALHAQEAGEGRS
jgi:transposase InsO family protein